MNPLPQNLGLFNLPEDATEPIVDQIFVPEFLTLLGFDLTERIPQFATGNGADTVDYALRQNSNNDIFLQNKTNPYILLELKGRDINLNSGSAQYKSTVKQLYRYLLSERAKTVQWGIITNSNHIQLFRKHSKVIYPATSCLKITLDNYNDIINLIKNKIENTPKALIVSIYNNKGGVGKTTTTINLAAILSLLNKKVLVIDFDPNQKDLTQSLNVKPGLSSLIEALKDRNVKVTDVISPYRLKSKSNKEFGFDVIPIYGNDQDWDEDVLRQLISPKTLKQKLEPLKTKYDYILIDTPPNWRIFSVSALYAADVVLIPAKHNNIFSLENAAKAIKQFIPEVQEKRKDGSPIALPIFFNGEKTTEASLTSAKKAITQIINEAKSDPEKKFDLLPYFYPRYTSAKKDTHIFELPSYANIANATFDKIPAVYKNTKAYSYYSELAKEYFIQ